MIDTVIEGALVFDGSGELAFAADVGSLATASR